MKILKYKKIVTIASIALLTSCNEGFNNNIENENEYGVKVVELSTTASYSGNDLGIYGREFDDLNDYTLRNKITKQRSTDGYNDYLSSYLIAKDDSQLNDLSKVTFGEISYEKTAHDMMEPEFLKEFQAKKGVGTKEKVDQVSNDIFGNEQSFILKGHNYLIEASQYIPEKISISKMGRLDASINAYRTNRSNLSVQYNTDPKNKNGVLLILTWDGSTQDMNMEQLGSLNMDIKNVIAVFDPNDSGTLLVPAKAMSKFPKNANINSVLMRGNSSLIEKDNKKHYIVATSEQVERIIVED
jgi:hypothetical protein